MQQSRPDFAEKFQFVRVDTKDFAYIWEIDDLQTLEPGVGIIGIKDDPRVLRELYKDTSRKELPQDVDQQVHQAIQDAGWPQTPQDQKPKK